LSRGESASYLVRRLKRDAPEVAEALAHITFSSGTHFSVARPAGFD
jgi:hypothetical protein